MEINSLMNISKDEQMIRNLESEGDKKKAQEIFEKILLQEMIKGMYKTTSFEEETDVEKDFYQERMVDILSDKIVEARILNLNILK